MVSSITSPTQTALTAQSHGIRFGLDHRCLYCGVALRSKAGEGKYSPGVYRRLQAVMVDSQAAEQVHRSTLEAKFRDHVKAPLDPEEIRFHELVTQALKETKNSAELEARIKELMAEENRRTSIGRAVDHIRNRKWGGQTSHDNLFVDVCQKCNGDDRGFIPFGWFLRGYRGDIKPDLVDSRDVFVPSNKPVLRPPEVEFLQFNVASGLSRIVEEDVRVPSGRGWNRRSFFVSALSNMLHDPNAAVIEDNLGERLRWVFEPVFTRLPKFFLGREFEGYLLDNKRGFAGLVSAMLREVIHPMRRRGTTGGSNAPPQAKPA